SHQHVGHAGHREGGETHFRVYIVAEAFRGKSRLERHRMINETLAGELTGGVHALAIHASAPGEGGAGRVRGLRPGAPQTGSNANVHGGAIRSSASRPERCEWPRSRVP